MEAKLTSKQKEFVAKYGEAREWRPFKMVSLHGREITTAHRLRDRHEYLSVGDTDSDEVEDWYYVWTEKAKSAGIEK